MEKRVDAKHSTVIKMSDDQIFGYFGWPTLALDHDGNMVVFCSGFRTTHVCPWGCTVMFKSTDQGENWSKPIVLRKSTIDLRDAGALMLDDGKMLISYFSSDTRFYFERYPDPEVMGNTKDLPLDFMPLLTSWGEDVVKQELGSFCFTVDKDFKVSQVYPAPVTAPHGPIKLKNGEIAYVGRLSGEPDGKGGYEYKMDKMRDVLQMWISRDEGKTWEKRCDNLLPDFHIENMYSPCEPTLYERQDGSLAAFFRIDIKEEHFQTWEVISEDGGVTWGKAFKVSAGGPPHILRHSSGALICTQGWRTAPYGIRAAISYDDGLTWSEPYILRDDLDWPDLGYASTVELPDGSLASAYYVRRKADRNAGILMTKWNLPEK